MHAPAVPQRSTLVAQTVALLEEGIRAGRWVGLLPGQHELCHQLLISRTTVRAALRALARRGLIDQRQGCPTRIRSGHPARQAEHRLTRAVVLLPEPLWRLRPSVGRWVGELRPQLQPAGIELVIVEGGRHYRRGPAAHLEKLVRAHPRAAWVLFASTQAMQSWFADRRLPVILVGPGFPGIALPSIEYDHAAIAQHAANRLGAAGHARMAILLQETGSAADATTCNAFAAACGPARPRPVVLRHDGSLAQIESRLRHLVGMVPRPTALFVTKTHALLAALTLLPRLGLAVPRDLSVICREDDPFLDFVTPAIARYHSDSSAIARKLAIALSRLAGGEPLPAVHDLLMPRVVSGRSVESPPVRPD